MAATASATVAIKLKVEGDASVKQALNRIEGRFAALDAKTKGMDNRLNSISTAIDKNAISIENHGATLEKHGKRYEDLDLRLTRHRDQMDMTKRYYKDLNTSMGVHREELKELRSSWVETGSSLKALSGDLKGTVKDFDAVADSAGKLHRDKLVPLDKELKRKAKDFQNLRNEMQRTNREFNKSEQNVDKLHRAAGRLSGDNRDGLFSKMFSRGMKFIKLFGIEFVAMTAVIAAFKGALFLGEMAMKGFNAALAGVGIAAGTAVAALSAFLAAQRELQVAKLSPFFAQNKVGATGPSNMYTQVSGIVGARQLQMFDQKTLGSIATEAAKSGDASKMSFRAMIDDLADFAIVATDPNKALTALVSNFMKAGKEGKITADMFKEISEASPELVKGFEEMYGGADKLKSAISSGKVNVNEFLEALNSGRLKSLEPFRNALEGVNDTLIGTFKGSLAQVKEQLIEIGMPLVDVLKRPLLVLEGEIRVLLMRIGPVIQRTFGQLFDGMGGKGGGLQRFMDRLAVLINENLPRLLNIGKKVQSWARTIGDLFSRLGGYLRRMTGSWDNLYNKILKPIGIEIGRTFNHLVEAFGKNINTNAEFADSFAARINDIGEGVRKLIDGFMHLKNALAPVIDSFTRLLQIFSKLMGAFGGFGQTLVAMGLTGMFMGRRRDKRNMRLGRGGAGGAAGGGGGMGGFLGTMMNPFMFPFGGMFGGGGRTPNPNSIFSKTRETYQLNRVAGGPLIGGVATGTNRRTAMKEASKTFFGEGSKRFFNKGTIGNFAKIGIPLVASIAGGLISGKSDQTSAGKQALGGALSGAGQGAMIGGMIGSVIPGIGTGIGAAIGGVVGGVSGAITGWRGAKQEEERQRAAARASLRERAYSGYQVNDIENLGMILERTKNALALIEGPRYDLYSQQSLIGETVGKSGGLAGRFFEGLLSSFYNAETGEYDMARLPTLNERKIGVMLSPSGMTQTPSGKNAAIATDIRDFIVGGEMGTLDISGTSFGGGLEQQIATLDKLIASGVLEESQAGYQAINDVYGEGITLLGDAKALRTQLEYLRKAKQAFPELQTLSGQELFDEYSKVVKEQEDKYTRLTHNVSALSEAMGMTGREAQQLASSMDLDLSESFLNMDSIIQALGYSTDDFANRATAAGRILRDVMSPIEERRAQRDLASRFDAAGKAITDVRISSMEDATVAAEDYVEANMEMLLGQYQRGEFTSYGQFAAATGQSFTGLLNDIGQAYGTDSTNYLALKSASDAVMALLESTDLGTRMQYDPNTALALDEKLAALVRPLVTEGATYEGSGADVAQQVAAYVRGDLGLTASDQFIDTIVRGEFATQAESIGANVDRLIQAMTDSLENISVNLDGQIRVVIDDEGNKVEGSWKVGDTSTPSSGGEKQPVVPERWDTTSSRLGRTMSKHIAFNSMVSGSRFVTSSYRTNNLGSINSDHVTGNAYDLTGDNLGQYAKNVNDAGGFAEFHGSAGSRHLHVVPPQGDSSTPASTVSGMDGGGVVINAPITINAKDGQSAREVAMIAVEEIKRLERSARERR